MTFAIDLSSEKRGLGPLPDAVCPGAGPDAIAELIQFILLLAVQNLTFSNPRLLLGSQIYAGWGTIQKFGSGLQCAKAHSELGGLFPFAHHGLRAGLPENLPL